MSENEGTVKIDLGNIIKKTQEDENFKKSLIERPQETLYQIGVQLPEEVEVRVVEESAKVMYLVLPADPDINTIKECTPYRDTSCSCIPTNH